MPDLRNEMDSMVFFSSCHAEVIVYYMSSPHFDHVCGEAEGRWSGVGGGKAWGEEVDLPLCYFSHFSFREDMLLGICAMAEKSTNGQSTVWRRTVLHVYMMYNTELSDSW